MKKTENNYAFKKKKEKPRKDGTLKGFLVDMDSIKKQARISQAFPRTL